MRQIWDPPFAFGRVERYNSSNLAEGVVFPTPETQRRNFRDYHMLLCLQDLVI